MSDIINNVKITGWSYRGLNVPDYDINLEDPNQDRNFSLILLKIIKAIKIFITKAHWIF